nr:PREDICTED: uncharacterized protein LOC109039841 [Bemisia tabaci]
MRFWGLLYLAVFFVTCSSMRNHSNSGARSASQRLAAFSRSWCSCLKGSQRRRRTQLERQNSASSWSSMSSFEDESDRKSRVKSTKTETSRFYAWRATNARMLRVPARLDAKSKWPAWLPRPKSSDPEVRVEKFRGTDAFIITERGKPNDASKDFTLKILQYITTKDGLEPEFVEEWSGTDARGEYKSTTYKRNRPRPIQREPTFPYQFLESDSFSIPPETPPRNPRERPSRSNQNPPPRNQPSRNQPPRNQPPLSRPPRYEPSAAETNLEAALIASAATEQPSAPVPRVPRDPRDKEADDDASDDEKCCICYSNYKNALMKPCGHLTICLTCAATQQRQSEGNPPVAFNCAECCTKVVEYAYTDRIIRAADARLASGN